MYHCVVNEDNKVVNVVLWDGKAVWHPGPGLRAISDPGRTGSIGDSYDEASNSFLKS